MENTPMMKAALLEELNGPLIVKEVPIPKPKPGQVLVKMEASPIHPADFSLMRGQYGMSKPLPLTPGLEGCGVVVENGGGLLGWKLKGQKVAVSSSPNSTGSWAEFMVVDSIRCIPLDKDISFHEGAFAIGNPLTALGFYDCAVNEKAKAVILSAACSAVARMSARYIESKGIGVINIVRRKEQEEILKGDGVKYVLNSNDEKFEENLKELVEKLSPTVFFDSVAGTLTGKVLKAMPNRSVCYMYGFLSKDKCEIDGRDLRYKDKTIKGFWLTNWIKEKGMVRMLSILSDMKSNLKTNLKTSVSKIVGLEDINDGINFYKKHMSEGKILIDFSKKNDHLSQQIEKSMQEKEEKKEVMEEKNIVFVKENILPQPKQEEKEQKIEKIESQEDQEKKEEELEIEKNEKK